jgi:hypothetical protein
MTRDEMLTMARGFLRVHRPYILGIDEGVNSAALSMAFSTGIQILSEAGEIRLTSTDYMSFNDANFSAALFALQDGRLRFISTDFSDLVGLAMHDRGAYDACLIISAYNLERGLTPELADMLRSHLHKPNRPKKGPYKMILRDHAIQETIRLICMFAKISPTRNGRNNNSGCDIVQEALTTLPEFKKLGLPSYEGVRKIWDERKFS